MASLEDRGYLEKAARGLTAYIGSLGILSFHAAKIYAVGLARLHRKPWEGDDPLCRAIPGQFLTVVDDFLRDVLETRVQIENTVTELSPEERVIYMGNHPTTNAVFSVLRHLRDRFADRIGAVSKMGNSYNPLLAPIIGIPGKLSGSVAFVRRNNTPSAIDSIRTACKTVFREGSGIVIFPDAHRPKARRIKRAVKDWADRIPGLEKWMHHTCPPYSGGIRELLLGTAHVPRRVINVTAGFDRPDYTVFDLPKLVGATLRMEIRDVSGEIPTDEDDLRAWLTDEWREKNRLLGLWKGQAADPA